MYVKRKRVGCFDAKVLLSKAGLSFTAINHKTMKFYIYITFYKGKVSRHCFSYYSNEISLFCSFYCIYCVQVADWIKSKEAKKKPTVYLKRKQDNQQEKGDEKHAWGLPNYHIQCAGKMKHRLYRQKKTTANSSWVIL